MTIFHCSLEFASCYVYSPIGVRDVSQRSRLLREFLKSADAHFLQRYAERVRLEAEGRPEFSEFFGPDAVLVPVPGNARSDLQKPTVSEQLAVHLVAQGLGAAVWTGLKRIRAVPKSATAAAGDRPSLDVHYESFRVEPPAAHVSRLVLLDDVVTKGRTLLAAAMRVRESCPHATVRGFALLRTMGRVPEVERLVEPCVGRIRLRGGDAQRTP
jgi:hypothetical protein